MEGHSFATKDPRLCNNIIASNQASICQQFFYRNTNLTKILSYFNSIPGYHIATIFTTCHNIADILVMHTIFR